VPGTDNSRREAIISCGAALDHLRIAMLAAGWCARIDRFPNNTDAANLASIEFSPVAEVADTELMRADAILQRRTDRLPLDRPTYWGLFEPVLRDAIKDGVAALHVLSDDARPQLVRASQLTEALRRDDWLYQTELDWWTSPFVANEGIPGDALLSGDEQRRVELGREFPLRGHEDRRPGADRDCSELLVLSTPEDTMTDALACGEALSTVLLECTVAGIATCTLTHLIEVAASRDIVRDLTSGTGQPQAVIRAGIAPLMEHPTPTPRRPLDEVLLVR
jgi:hypothetical protein